MTIYDVFAIAVILVSALAGYVRGGARELVTILAFVASALIALLLLPFTGPLARDAFGSWPSWAANAVAVLLIFVGFYIAIHLFGVWLSQKLRQTEKLTRADRFVGLGVGLLRALVLLGVLHLVFYATTPVQRVPAWYKDAVFHPVSRTAARVIQLVLPKGAKTADAVAPKVAGSLEEGSAKEPRSLSRAAPDDAKNPAR